VGLGIVVNAQEPITYDFSKMVGTPVAMEHQPITNKLVLYPVTATNYISSTNYWCAVPSSNYWIAFAVSSNNYAITNSYASSTRISIDKTIEQLRKQGDITNLVKQLIANGDVCAVTGHKWKYMTSSFRYCTDCRKEEHKKEVWEQYE